MEPTNKHSATHASLFARIPAELRNIIYKYTLTEDQPLSLEHPDGLTVDSTLYAQPRRPHQLQILATGSANTNRVGEVTEANQLRFVNKQMYHETTGLSLHYNTITFGNVNDMDYFLEHCATKHLDKIRLLTVHWPGHFTADFPDIYMWQPLSKFCQLHSNAMVRVHVSGLSPNKPRALLWLGRYETQVRGTEHLFDAMIEDYSEFRELFRPTVRLEPGMPVVHENIRFSPTAEIFDKEKLVRNVEELRSFVAISLVLTLGGFKEGLDGMVSMMRRVVEHGA